MSQMLADLKFAIRHLRKSPGFTVTAVLTLALGIGANTAIFTLVDSIMLRPLPFPEQNRLTQIGSTDGLFPKGWIRALGAQSTRFEAISGFGSDDEANVGDANSAKRVFGSEVMANALQALDVHPALGRFFGPDDAISGRDPVVVLSNGFWRQQFGADPATLGKTIRIDGVFRRVIGIMPAGVQFPYQDTQFLVPVTFKGGDPTDAWWKFNLRAFGRLRSGAKPSQAQAELRQLRPILLQSFPWRMPNSWASELSVVPLLESEVGATRPRLVLLFAAVGLVLLIACANVANLMLARAATREREIAIRGALGASAPRVIRQLLIESIVVSGAAGILGLLAASGSLEALVALLPADTPRIDQVSLHWPVFLFTAAASIVTGLFFGIIPALQMASRRTQQSLHAGSRSVAGKTGQFRLSRVLVMGQISLSVIVITGAGLMLHSLWGLSKVDPGFRADRIVTAEVSLDASACQTGRCQSFFQMLLSRLEGVPEADNEALTDSLPLSGRAGNYVYDAEGHPRNASQKALVATARTVSPGYFRTLGLRLLRGRLLDNTDASGTSHAVVIDEQMANRLWPHQDPIGRHVEDVHDEPSPGVWDVNTGATVVGVVTNTREGSLAAGFGDQVYFPLTPKRQQPSMYLIMQTRANPHDAASEIRGTVAGIDPSVPVTRIRTLNEVVASSESASRSLTILLLAFGALAVIIGGVGVYSTIAYIVSWRTREIGIRLALGAQRWQIINSIVGQSLFMAIAGSIIGLAASAMLGRLLTSFLYEVQPVDPVTFCAVPMLMVALALVAAWLPARRAASVSPVRTLKAE